MAALIALCGCDDGAGPRVGRGPEAEPAGAPSTSTAPAMPAPPSVATPGEARGRGRRAPAPSGAGSGGRAGAGAGGQGPSASPPAAGQRARAEREQRLGRQLASAFGSPTACISEPTRQALSDRLVLRVQVRVSPMGRVLSANVGGSHLSAEDRACLERHAEGIRLPGPIEDAPRTVSTSIEYAVQDTRSSRTERVVPDRGLHPGTVAPDHTLPAPGEQ